MESKDSKKYYYMESKSGNLVRVPEDKLEAWQQAQENLGSEEQKAREQQLLAALDRQRKAHDQTRIRELENENRALATQLRNAQDALQITQQDLQLERDHARGSSRSGGIAIAALLLIFAVIFGLLLSQVRRIRNAAAETERDLRSAVSGQYDSGYSDGYGAGYDEGYADGQKDLEASKYESYLAGLDEGYASGVKEAKAAAAFVDSLENEDSGEEESNSSVVRSAPSSSGSQTAAKDYVLNTNTKKFHVPSCSSASQIHDENRSDVHDTRDNIIASGYSPCGKCHP